MKTIFNYFSLFPKDVQIYLREGSMMNREQLHRLVAESTGNESNICQIYAIRDGRTVYDDCWHGFKTDDAMNVNSVTKGGTFLP